MNKTYKVRSLKKKKKKIERENKLHFIYKINPENSMMLPYPVYIQKKDVAPSETSC